MRVPDTMPTTPVLQGNTLICAFPFNSKQGYSQDFYKGGAQLEGEVVIVSSEAAHGQLCWP